MSAWQQLEITTTADYADEISHLLNEHGALSVSLKDGGDQELFQLLPDETPLWTETKVIALFSEQTNVQFIVEQIKNEVRHAPTEYHISILEDQDWVRQTQQNFPPQCFAETLWVIPSWCDTRNYGGYTIRIDPGLAFGTGTHPTTALCLEWLARHPPTGLTVIDYGSGSGILALAALAMGAKEVYAVDHDKQAIQATENNARLNDFANKKLHILTNDEMPILRSSLIIANILSQPLITLASYFNQLATSDATLVLSGILTKEINVIAEAYSENFKIDSARTKEEWIQLTLTRK